MIIGTRLRPKCDRSNQNGLAAVELAIMLPLVLLLMMTTAEFARIFYMSNTLTKAVRDGARYLSDNAFGGTTKVIQLVPLGNVLETQNMVAYGNIGGTGNPVLPAPPVITVTAALAAMPLNISHIQVTATYNYTPIFGTVLPTLGLTAQPINVNFPLQATEIMRAIN